MRWVVHIARIVELRNARKMFVVKPEGKKPLGRRSRWEDNIKMHLREIWWEGVY
jgi:hypothetical protein